jgi:hypothetical protein
VEEQSRSEEGEDEPGYVQIHSSDTGKDGIEDEHHGHIEVSSVVGKGSKFEVVLPFSMPVAEVAAT